MNNYVFLVIAIIANILLNVFSNWLFEIAKEKEILITSIRTKRFILTLLFFVPLVILLVWLQNSDSGDIRSVDNANAELTVDWISDEKISVLWKNLDGNSNQYIMLTDGNWYYNPIKIWGESGNETIAPGDGITRVAIIEVSENVLLNDIIGGIEVNDSRISQVIIQVPMPEQ